MVPWTKKDIPPQTGKVVLITGATSGLGFETALYFLESGATVIAAGRNESKGKETLNKLKTAFPNAKAEFGKVDLSSLASISEFGQWFHARYQVLDILINNAGIGTKTRQTTEDGFEMQMGTNHLGHFALTGLLLPALKRSESARVVNVSSLAANIGWIDFEDLQREKSFKFLKDYGASKLANLLFTFELQRRSDAAGWGLTVTALQPGRAATEGVDKIQADYSRFAKWLSSKTSHSPADGALITMYAATALESKKCGYYGPQGLFGFTGPPGNAWLLGKAKDADVANKLWQVSETLTKVTWPPIPMSD